MLTQTTRRSTEGTQKMAVGGGGGGGMGNGPLPSFLPFYFRVRAFRFLNSADPTPGPDYLSLEQANSDVTDDIMSEKMNEVLKSYTLLYLRIKVKLCHSPSA